MYKVTRIMTEDGCEFESSVDAREYLEKEYGDLLLKLSAKLVAIEKHVPMCEFVNTHLNDFVRLADLNKEIDRGIEEEEDL